MKINVSYKPNQDTIAVWFGKMGRDGFLYRNGKIDLEQGKKRYNYFWELKHNAKGGR
jgi:hypothetical protein